MKPLAALTLAATLYHCLNHAFFKSLLFMCSGSVIHAMAGEQDMRRMGGLRAKIPYTYWTMLMGTLAIVWWTRNRRIPTLKFSYTPGKGESIELDWIQLR